MLRAEDLHTHWRVWSGFECPAANLLEFGLMAHITCNICKDEEERVVARECCVCPSAEHLHGGGHECQRMPPSPSMEPCGLHATRTHLTPGI